MASQSFLLVSWYFLLFISYQTIVFSTAQGKRKLESLLQDSRKPEAVEESARLNRVWETLGMPNCEKLTGDIIHVYRAQNSQQPSKEVKRKRGQIPGHKRNIIIIYPRNNDFHTFSSFI